MKKSNSLSSLGFQSNSCSLDGMLLLSELSPSWEDCPVQMGNNWEVWRVY